MNNIKKLILTATSLVVAGLVTVSVFKIGVTELFGKIAVLSLMTTAPEGAYGMLEDLLNFSETETLIPDTGEIITESFNPTAAPNTEALISVAVTEQKMGNIIKRSMSPYGANTKYNNVYINNKSGEEIDIAADLSGALDFKVTKSKEPQILIYHTHTTEAFMNDESEYYTNRDEPRSRNPEENMVRIGEIIAKQLENSGYAVVHDKTIHDSPAFSGSYNRSAQTVKNALKQYPSIKIAIDVHRDSVTSGNDKVAPVVVLNGREAAQVMLVMGSQTGSVTNHPEWRKNLRLATKLQNVFESNYPQLARAMLLKSAKYNQDLTTGSILLEVGSDANTYEQAEYSAELIGQSLTVLLNSQQ